MDYRATIIFFAWIGFAVSTNEDSYDSIFGSAKYENLDGMNTDKDGYRLYPSLNRAYKFRTDIKTWYEAKLACRLDGAELAMPMTSEEAEALRVLFGEHPRPTIKGRKPDKILLDFHDMFRQGEFLIEGGDSIQYAYHKWEKGDPKIDNKRCGSMNRNAEIDDFSCDSEAAFVCQKGSGLDRDDVDAKCASMDSLYKEFGGKCYKFHIEPKTWSEARAVCHAEGGFLAIVTSKREEEHLVALMNRPENEVTHSSETCCALIGFHDMFKENQFVAVSGKTLNEIGHANWRKGYPSKPWLKSKNCGSLHKSGGLVNLSCDSTAPFICQRPMLQPVDERYEPLN